MTRGVKPDGYPPIECVYCGVTFTPTQGKHKWCTPKCRKDDEYKAHMLDYYWKLKKLLAMAKNRASTQEIPFELDHQYLVDLWEYQEGRCSISKQPFDLSPPNKYSVNPDAPSLDKIIPRLGYIKGNVRLVCYQINMALGEYGEDQLIEMCKRIAFR